MNTTVDWQAWIPVLQIQIGATAVILVAACLAQFVAVRRNVVREWLWRISLFGVLASMLIPFVNRVAPAVGPELAILQRGAATSHSPRSEQDIDRGDTSNSPTQAMPRSDQTPIEQPTSLADTPVATAPNVVAAASNDVPISVADRGPVQPVDDVRVDTGRQGWILRTLLVFWVAGILCHIMGALAGTVICGRIVAAAIPLDHSDFDEMFSRLRRSVPVDSPSDFHHFESR